MAEKDFSKYKLDLIKSPIDPRDIKFKSVYRAIELPSIVDYRDTMFPVRDQGSQGSCAAMSGAAMKEWQEIKDVGITDYLSPQFIYNMREDTGQEGMTNRDLMKILQKKGVCYENLYPYGTLSQPSQEAFANALNFTIANYAVMETIDEVKAALFIKGPCIVAVPVYNYTTRMWYQRPDDKFLGGHDMCVAAYNDELNAFWIRNSWGTDFGESGYVKMSYQDFILAWEWWSSVDLDTNFDPEPEPEPEPEKKGCLVWFLDIFRKPTSSGASGVKK